MIQRWKWVVIALTVLVMLLQLNKRNTQKILAQKREIALKLTNNHLSKVLFQLPIYRDSVYKVFIIKFKSQNKIIFLKKGEISEKQKGSSFFVHIYPKDKKKLKNGLNHIPNNFKNNVTSFLYKNEEYFISETNLPEIKISKLNLGQFGFRGGNGINWKIPKLLTQKKIGKILKDNKEDVQLFELIGDSF